ncbi:tandem-95 repeat protein [Singulisphaera sp. Ch08]|uniref:Tandem-95 repeat protein n=1 Tax=Singulisphaera sp. Ch08 TaxID=3120278 RepID=A0AAU7CFF6_9BACT
MITELNRLTGAEIRRFNAPVPANPSGENGLAFDGQLLYYMPQDGSGRLWELNPDSGSVIRSPVVTSGFANIDGLGAVGGKVYLQDHYADQIIVINPANGFEVGRLNVAADLVGGLAGADSPNELIGTERLDVAVRINPSTGSVLGRFLLPGPVYGAAFVDGNYYFGSAFNNRIYVVQRSGDPLYTLTIPYPVSALAGDGVEVSPSNERVLNGDFERGDLTGWLTNSVSNALPRLGYQVYSGTGPWSWPLPTPPQGNFAATNELMWAAPNLVEAKILYQDVFLPTGQFADLSMLIGYQNFSNAFLTPNSLDTHSVLNQQFRIDIVDPSASLLSTAAADVLMTIFQTRAGAPNILAPTAITADLSSFAGQTVRLRIAVAANQADLVTVIDAVSIKTNSTSPSVGVTPYYVADFEEFGGGSKRILRIDPTTGVQSVVSSGGQFIAPYGVTIASDGSLIVADRGPLGGTGTLFRIDPTTGTQSVITTGGFLVDPTGVVIDRDGSLLVADFASGGTGQIIRVNPSTGVQTYVIDVGPVAGPFGIALSPDGLIYTAQHAGFFGLYGQILCIEPTTSTRILVSIAGFLSAPSSLVVAPDGSLIVSDRGASNAQGAILRITPQTGGQTVISQAGFLQEPVGITLTSNSSLIIADIYANLSEPVRSGALLAVDLISGMQSIVATSNYIRNPTGVATVPAPTIPSPLEFDAIEDTLLRVAAPGVLANSSGSSTFVAFVATEPAHGTLTLSSDGSFDYQPAADYFGLDSFTYVASNGLAFSAPRTVNITVSPVNDAPTANNDTYITPQAKPLIVPAPGLLANDTDADGDTLTLTFLTFPTNGNLHITGNGGFVYTPISNFVGTDTFTYLVMDGVQLSLPVVVTIHVTPTPIKLTDHGQLGFSQIGPWTSAEVGGYGGSVDFVPSGDGSAKTTWFTDGLEPGTYEIHVTWLAGGNRASNAPYRIYDGNTLLKTVWIDQRNAPAGTNTQGNVVFQSLGTATIVGTSLRVVLSNDADGFVIADAIFIREAIPFSPRFADDGQPGFSETGTWIPFTTSSGGTARYAAPGDGSASATWFRDDSVTPGSYQVMVTWSAGLNRASNALYRIYDGNRLVKSVRIDQRNAPVGPMRTRDGVFQKIGEFKITGDSIRVVLSNDADGYVIADTIYISEPTYSFRHSDDNQPSTSQIGTWETFPSGYEGSARYTAPGDGSASFTWVIGSMTPGTYEVNVTWGAGGNRASNALYKFYDGNSLILTIRIDQRKAPDGLLWSDNLQFQKIAVVTITGSTLRVVLSNDADGYVIADAVLLGDRTDFTPKISDDSFPSSSRTGTWVNFSGGYTGARYAAPGDGSTSHTWTQSTLVPRAYDIQVTWNAGANRASNALYRIYDGDILLKSVRVDQRLAPIGVSMYGSIFQSLGTVMLTGTTLRVVLSNDADGYVIADAIRISEPIPILPKFSDDTQPNTVQSGTWESFSTGYGDTARYSAPGDGSASLTWVQSALAPDTYEIQVTWNAGSNRASNALYQIYDDNTLIKTVRVDQRDAPIGGVTENGIIFQSLGTVTITGTTIRITLSNDADGYVIADAIRISAASSLRAAGGANSLPDRRLVNLEDLPLIVDAALARWRVAGVEESQLEALRTVPIRIVDLPGDELGLVGSDGIAIDHDAAGYGWFIDPTPDDDFEFAAGMTNPTAQLIDLLSVLGHEFGHLLGLEHEAQAGSTNVMADTLQPGSRRVIRR